MIGPVVLILRVMLALALYAFLALALWMLSQDIKLTGLGVAGRAVPSIRLKIHTKKRRALYQDFSQAEVTLGRDPWSDVPLTDKSVSARHARLSFQQGHWWLEDLKSTTGTRLNHQRLSRSTVLTVGDEITCGQVRVVVSSTSRAVQSAMPRVDSRDG
jgi:pSer/pThr/pTyr-binding forkhead associated (FHA) protein